MRKILFALLCLAFISAGCKKEEAVQQHPAGALAEVDGQYITRVQVDDIIKSLPPEQKKYALTPFGEDGIVDVLVREQLMAAAARATNVQDSPAYRQIMEDMRKDFEARLAAAEKYNLIKAWKENLRATGVISVSQKEIDDYYKKYNYEMTIRQIVVADAETAQAVLAQARAGHPKEAKFVELAKKFSSAPQADIEEGQPFTFIPGEYMPEIENAAANSSAGSVQGFIKTKCGFHIIYKVSENKISAANAKDRIVKIIENQKLDRYLDGLAQKYKAEVYKTYEN